MELLPLECHYLNRAALTDCMTGCCSTEDTGRGAAAAGVSLSEQSGSD